MGNLAEYIARSYVIRDATEEGENTADRVGSAFLNGGDVFTSILLVKSNNGRLMTSRDDAIVAQGNTITFGTGWDMFHGSGYFMAGGNVVVPQTVTVGAASGVVYLDVTDNLFKWASTTELLAEKSIIVAHTKDDAIVEVFANRYMLNGKVCGNGVGSGTDMATVWASLADNGSQQINVSHLRDALGGCTWWGSGMSGGAVTGSLSDVLNITMTGRISINGFVIEYDSENNALRFNGSIYATGSVSALGYQSGGGGGGSSTLADLFDVQLTTPIGDGDVLTYDTALGKWTNGTGGGTGSVTSVVMTTPTGLRVNNGSSATITSSGTFALTIGAGYTIPKTDDVSKGVAAYGWGNHATKGYATEAWVSSQGYTTNAGTVTRVGLSVPIGFSVTGSPITTSGTLAVGFASGYSLPLTSKQAQWDAAYSWGDHSQEGYATEAWVNAKGYTTNTGTVTSVRMTVPAGLTVTGSPITTSGTLAISLGIGYSIPTTAKQSQWDTAYGWGNHANAGYASQSALASAVSRIGTLEGYFTNGVANQAARLSGTSTYQAWGQTFWQNGTPKSIGSASARANINYAGSVSMGWTLNMEYDDAVHDPSINIKSSKTGTNLSVFMLSNSATSDHSGDHLAIGWGTSAKAQLPIRFFGREFVFNYTTNTMSGGNYSTAEAMKVGYRMLDSREEPAVYVRKHLMIGNGAGDYFPVTYDSTNNALCFSGNIYATGGVSALGFSSTQNGGALINGTLAVQSSATVSGNTSIGGTLSVTGATTLSDALTVGKLATFNKGITVSMQATLAQLRATGTVTGTLSVTGACSFGGRISIVWNGREYYLNVQEMINKGFLS